MTGPRVSELFVYPLKSAGAVALEHATLDGLGLCHDRRWMVVTPEGRFISQREQPRLALVRPTLIEDRLELRAPNVPPLLMPVEPDDRAEGLASIWKDTVEVAGAGADADAWIRRVLGIPCRMVHMPGDAVRRIDPRYAAAGERVAFVDGFPLLLITEASLIALNARLSTPLPMNRFRPNVVVAGAEPYEEDDWSSIAIGDVRVDLVKPCSRCVITTTDQETARRGDEPLRTLATYRKRGDKVFFGQNGIHRATGELHVGQEVRVLKRVGEGGGR